MSADEDLSERIDDILRAHKEMPPETCATVRRRACDGETPTEIAHDNHINWAEATVRQHARGHCNHDIEQEPITPPYNTRHAPLTPAECAHIRRQRALGIRASYIAERMDCDENTVYTHENGQCSHENEDGHTGECQ